MHEGLSQRLSFIAMENVAPELQQLGRQVEPHLRDALSRFYERIAANPETARFFSGKGQMDRASSAQFDHWTALFRNGFTPAYYQQAEVIGNVHSRIGLEPKWYIGGYGMILDHLITRLVAPGWQALLPWKRRQARQLSLLVRTTLVDMDLALSTYFTAESAERETMLAQVGTALERLADGDLTSRMVDLPVRYKSAETHFNAALDRLQQTIAGVASGIESISTASAEIRSASDDLAQRNELQAASIEETAAAMSQATQSMANSAQSANEVRSSIAQAHDEATEGGAVVLKAIEAMAQIEQSSQQIAQIIGVIDGIAFQTNLLALNAGVEAARAGDSGKGFAVVANEVRALAQRSADAARDIKELITTSSQQVEGGVALVGETGTLLEKIVSRVGEINVTVASMADAASEQAANLKLVNAAVVEMDQMTQQNAAMVEQSTAASRSLADEANQLAGLVSQFRTEGGAPASLSTARPVARRRSVPAPKIALTHGNLAVAAPAETDDWSEF